MGNSLQKEIEKNKKKEIVDLRKRGISDLPGAISVLRCREFIIAENDISTLPDEIGKMSELIVLDASFNRINGLPFEIGQLKNLKELNLSNNKLFFAPLTPEIGNLKSLVKLDLSGNQLDELPSQFANLSALEHLNVSNNQLKIFPVEFGIFHIFIWLYSFPI
jgi:leucine-rich repeat protein SHOC2